MRRDSTTVIRVALLAVLIIGSVQVSNTFAQKLDALRNELRGTDSVVAPASPRDERPGKKRSRRQKSRSSRKDDDEEGFFECLFEDLFGDVLVFGATSPYWIPTAYVEDDFRSSGYYLDYPYENNMLISDYRHGRSFLETSLFRLRLEAGSDFDDVSLIGARLLWDTPIRFAFDIENNYRHEQLSEFYDELWTGDANFVYRFAQSPRMQMRSGLGVNWLSDEDETDFGFNFTYGGDFMAKDPFILSLESDVGAINSEFLFHGRATLGVNYKHAEIYGGYDYFRIGGESIGSVVAGLRFWF